MSLQNWLQIGHLIKHQATVAEVRSLLGVVDRELADASVAGLSDEQVVEQAPVIFETLMAIYVEAGR